MGLSPFDRRLLTEGLAYFTTPRLASLLDLLGRNEVERLATLTAMLRNSSEDEVDEVTDLFERALARVAREQARAARREADPDRS
jgi:flagellar motor switch protein FliG